MTQIPEALPVRTAARVLLVDPEDRILLFRSNPREHGGAYWYPVGGAVEEGESDEDAVIREAFEETGLRGLRLGPEVFHRRFVFHWRDAVWDARERWWFTRVEHFEPVFTGMEAIEIDDFSACRWMSIEDLRAARDAGDILTPDNVLDYLPVLLAGRFPAIPIAVGE